MSCKCDSESSKKVCDPCICDPCVCPSRAVVGERAPDFSTQALMPDGTFKTVCLKQYLGKYLVLFFYPMDFTFVCPTEIIAFSDRFNEFRDCNCELLAASCDSVYSHLAWTKVPRSAGGISQLNIPILADKDLEIAKTYGILIPKKGISLRGLFIIDTTGVLRQITVNDLPVGRSVDETLRLVNAFQYTDQYGETCPINWKKGDKALNPAKSSEYFSSTYH